MTGAARKYISLTKAAVCAAAAFAAGCTQKDLYFPSDDTETIVDVEFDWTDAQGASVEGMSTFFFPLTEGGRIWNFEIPGMSGGPVAIHPGSYVMLAVNNDLPGVDISAETSASSVTINTRFRDDGTLMPSGMVYGTVIDNVAIPALPSGDYTPVSPSQHIIQASPDSLATVYNVILYDVAEADMISNMYARLSGVAASLNLKDNTRGGESASINIPIDISPKAMCGSTSALGTPSGIPQFKLTLYAELTDRRTIARSLEFDITGQVTQATHPHNVYIILSGITFDTDEPDNPGQGDGVGMEVGVDGWSTINIDLISGS